MPPTSESMAPLRWAQSRPLGVASSYVRHMHAGSSELLCCVHSFILDLCCNSCLASRALAAAAGTTSPAFKGSRLKANAKGSYENPHLKVEGQQEVAVDTEGANHDIKEMKGQQTADVDARDKQQRNADPKNQQGRVGTQTTGPPHARMHVHMRVQVPNECR